MLTGRRQNDMEDSTGCNSVLTKRLRLSAMAVAGYALMAYWAWLAILVISDSVREFLASPAGAGRTGFDLIRSNGDMFLLFLVSVWVASLFARGRKAGVIGVAIILGCLCASFLTSLYVFEKWTLDLWDSRWFIFALCLHCAALLVAWRNKRTFRAKSSDG